MFDCFQTDEEAPDIVLPEGKVGAKKMRKLEEKAERKRQREVPVEGFLFIFSSIDTYLLYTRDTVINIVSNYICVTIAG